MEGLGEETLDLPGAEDGHLVLVVELVHPENGDNVLKVLVALKHELDATGDPVVLRADDIRGKRLGGGGERVHRWEQSLLREGTLQHHGRVKVGEGVRRGRVGKVVRRDVNCLDGGDGALVGGGDALLENGHFLGKGRLVAHGGRGPAKKRGNLGARLGETEDVVHEEKDVLAFLIAEILCHREGGEGDAETRTRRLVHLAVAKSHFGAFGGENGVAAAVEFRVAVLVLLGGDNAGLDHFPVEVVSFPGPLTHTGEDGETAVRFGDVVDELHDDDRFADTGTTEHAALATLEERADEVDHLDTGHENFGCGGLVGQGRSGAMDGRAVARVFQRLVLVHEIAGDVEDPSEHLFADRHGDGLAGVREGHPALEAVRGGHGDRTHPAIAKVLLHFKNQLGIDAVENVLDLKGVVDFRQFAGFREIGVDDGADDLDDGSLVAHKKR